MDETRGVCVLIPDTPGTSGTAESSTRDTVSDHVIHPRKNGARNASIFISAIATCAVIGYGIYNKTEDVYQPDESSTQKNTTNVCYRKKEMKTFSNLFATALGLFSILLGTGVDRLTLLWEERHHLNGRYGGRTPKMIKACFSGIQKGPVAFLIGAIVLLIVVISSCVEHAPPFEMRYIIIIASGIGVGPLVMQLLNLNTQSEVYISTILEERGMYVANALAWSYYVNYLLKAMPKFNKLMQKLNNRSEVKLSSTKLLLLIPHDCRMINFNDGNYIQFEKYLNTKYYVDDDEVFQFPVYRLRHTNEVKRFVLQYVTDPLETLKYMSARKIEPMSEHNCEEEVLRLYQKLSNISKETRDTECYKRYIPILISIKLDDSNHQELVNLIMTAVEEDAKKEAGMLHKELRKSSKDSQKNVRNRKNGKSKKESNSFISRRKKPKDYDGNKDEKAKLMGQTTRPADRILAQEVGDGDSNVDSTSGLGACPSEPLGNENVEQIDIANQSPDE